MALTFHFVRYPDGFVAALAHSYPDEEPTPPPFALPQGTTETTREAWQAAPIHYMKSGRGGVLDQDHRRGGDTLKYIEHGWIEIRKAEFDALLPVYMAEQQARRDAWIAEMDEEGPEDFSGFEKVAANLEKAPKTIAIDV
jgi:hypothetical protein